MNRLKLEIVNQYGSQRKFALSLPMHETTLSNIISGILAPNEDQKELIVKALGIEWNELIQKI